MHYPSVSSVVQGESVGGTGHCLEGRQCWFPLWGRIPKGLLGPPKTTEKSRAMALRMLWGSRELKVISRSFSGKLGRLCLDSGREAPGPGEVPYPQKESHRHLHRIPGEEPVGGTAVAMVTTYKLIQTFKSNYLVNCYG